MNRSMRLAALALCAAALGACGRTDVLPVTCRQITCPSGFTCDPFTGACQQPEVEQDGGRDGGWDGGGWDGGGDVQLDAGIDCYGREDCSNPTPSCDPVTLQCRPCRKDPECGADKVCTQDGQCQPIPDSCAIARELVFRPGVGTLIFEVDTRSARDDVAGSCNPGGGRELVFHLRPTSTSNVAFAARRAKGSQANPAIYVRKAPCASGAELACSSKSGFAESLQLESAPPGDYYLFVETSNPSGGAMEVSVSIKTPPPSSNDSCLGAQTLVFFNGAASISGSTRGATNGNPPGASTPSCSLTARQSGADVVYTFALSEARDVRLTVTPTGAKPTLRPVMYVRGPQGISACDSDTELGCVSAGNGPISPQTLLLPNLQPGTYFVWVDGVGGSSGPFLLQAATASPQPPNPPPNDACSAPQVLSVGSVVSGDTTLANDDYSRGSSPAYSATCMANGSDPYTGRDVVYQFTATASTHTLTLSPATNFDPALMLLSPACGASSCVSSSDTLGNGSPETLTVNTTPGTLWYVVVDSWNRSSGYSSGTFNLGLR